MKYPAIACFLICAFVLNAQEKKSVQWAAVPAPSYNEVQGLGLQLTGGLFYRLNKKDTISRPTSTFVYGFWTENKTWIGAFLHESYFNQNKYWFDLLAATGDFKFRYFLNPGFRNDDDLSVNYSTKFTILKFNFLRQIKGGFYAGLHFKLSNFNTEYELENSPIDSLEIPTRSQNAYYSALGIKLAFDNRDHRLNPKKGSYVTLTTRHYRDFLGSEAEFNVFEIEINKYFSLAPKHILATRFFGYIGTGDVPFEEQALLGYAGPRGNDVRGYSTGRYRGDQLYDLQAEWRWNFYKRFGMVCFGSLALVGDDADHISKNGLLPAIGIGARYIAAVEENVNVGLDIAKGKEDWGIYFIITEAF